jgi:MATE family multidrug resistance protein
MNKRILRLALPNIITNMTVPLLGMTDLIIAGRIHPTDNASYIGAIAIGTTVFNFIYWNFGFLRMGTSGFTAQAYGAQDLREAMRVLVRGIFIALLIGLIVLLLQIPIAKLSLYVIDASANVESLVLRYFFVRIWAAPATLALYSFKGWFIGMQNARIPMFIAIVMNVINIFCSALFVFAWEMDVEGVALGTVLSQYGGLLLAIIFWTTHYRRLGKYFAIRSSLIASRMKVFFSVNADIFFRSLCLNLVFSFFPIAGAKISDAALALNTLLLQFFTVFAYVMDGFAYAGEALAGRYIGARDRLSLKRMTVLLFRWGLGLSVIFMIVYAFWGKNLLHVFTSDAKLIAASVAYYGWVIGVPLAGFAAFLWDGIYIGATASRTMLLTMLIATAVFFGIYYALSGIYPNHGLWLALLFFLFSRGVVQTLLAKKAVFGQILPPHRPNGEKT